MSAIELPDYAPVPETAFGPPLNEQGYYVGRVERNLFWVTDGTYQSAFLATSDGIVLFAPPTFPPSPPAQPSSSSSRSASTSGPAHRSTHERPQM
jgi:hypothetical protein